VRRDLMARRNAPHSEDPEPGSSHSSMLNREDPQVLRVVVNLMVEPVRVVSVFVDRQMKGKP
jgi:hypothetical protein